MGRTCNWNMPVEFETLEAAAPSADAGLRITCIPGIPGTWAEALRNCLEHCGISYRRIAHPHDQEGKDRLYALTAQKSVPAMFLNDERPRISWIEQMALLERLVEDSGQQAGLFPADVGDRVRMIGLMHEIAGENGICWYARILLVEPNLR